MPGKHANNWDNRYDEDRFFYGEAPNDFVARELHNLPTGRGLFLAEGEGRNAAFAAGLGHDVVAVDNSKIGRRKALELASRAGVQIEYRCEDIIDWRWADEKWDFVVLCFAHMGPDVMGEVHRRVVKCLRPAGKVILVSFAKSQFGRKSGGPPRLEWLHDVEILREEYAGVRWERLVEVEVELRESIGHVGDAMVVEGVGGVG